MKICLITLGCPKNIVEGESISGLLAGKGFQLATDIHSADAAIVHTCSFIADARNESAQVIQALSRFKEEGSLPRLIVSGCMVQEEGKKLQAIFPQVDGFIGTGDLLRLPELLKKNGIICGEPGGLLESPHPRLLSSALPSAYLRLSEGCNHRCSFCLIPSLRGSYKSREMGSIEQEARELAAEGIRELILIGQDTTYYGRDLYKRFALPGLLKKLATIKDVRWLRLMYAHPGTVTDELIDVLRSEEKLCRYLDIPLQHVNETVLRAMGRPANARAVTEQLKNKIPNLALRTTLIAGFPGETEKQFKELYDFVAEGWFDQLGVFEYSPHPALRSHKLPRQVPDSVKKARKEELMLLQQKIVARKNRALAGSTVDVLVESAVKAAGGITRAGRTQFQAPEIDSKIFFAGKARVGTFTRVKITGYKSYDLIGQTKGGQV